MRDDGDQGTERCHESNAYPVAYQGLTRLPQDARGEHSGRKVDQETDYATPMSQTE